MVNDTYWRLFNWEEPELFDECAQNQFNFFQCKSHADTVTRTHTERHKGIGIQISFIFCIPAASINDRDQSNRSAHSALEKSKNH